MVYLRSKDFSLEKDSCGSVCMICNNFSKSLNPKSSSSINFSSSKTNKFFGEISLEGRLMQSLRSLTKECVEDSTLEDFKSIIETYPLEREGKISCVHLMLQREDKNFLDKIISVPVYEEKKGNFLLSHYENLFLRHDKNTQYIERNPEVLGLLISQFCEGKDIETHHHNMRVEHMTRYLANELGYEYLESSTGMLHDSGKPFIPYEILAKPGKLTPDEFKLMKTHVQNGDALLKGFSGLEQAREVALMHHEREDGNGYNKIPGIDPEFDSSCCHFQ